MVFDAKADILNLRGTWESIPEVGDVATIKVREDARRFAQRILSIPDHLLDTARQILKYEYGGYAWLMAASTGENNTLRLSSAEASLRSLEKALALIKNARSTLEIRIGQTNR